jgi:hypothetical protein
MQPRSMYVAGCALAAASVLGCGVPFPPSGNHPDSIYLILTNTTDFPVDPGIYVDDDVFAFFVNDLIADENYVDTGVLDPLTQVTYEVDCEVAGTILSDYAILFLDEPPDVVAENAPVVTLGLDYFCGDDVEMIFIDTGVEFYTRVEVNGSFVED